MLRALEIAALAGALLCGALADLVAVLERTRAIQPAEFPEVAGLFAAAGALGAVALASTAIYFATALLALERRRRSHGFDAAFALRVFLIAAMAANAIDARARLVAILAMALLAVQLTAERLERWSMPPRFARRLRDLGAVTPVLLCTRIFPTLTLWCALAFGIPACVESLALLRGGAGLPFAIAAAARAALWLALLLCGALGLAVLSMQRLSAWRSLARCAFAFALFFAFAEGDPQSGITALAAALLFGAAVADLDRRGFRDGRLALIALLIGLLVAVRLRGLWFGILGQEIEALEIEGLTTTVLALAGAGCAAWSFSLLPRPLSLVLALLGALLFARAATPRYLDFSTVTAPIHAALVAYALLVAIALVPRRQRRALPIERACGIALVLCSPFLWWIGVREWERAEVRHAVLVDAPFARAAWSASPSFASLSLEPANAAPAPASEERLCALELESRYPDAPEAARFAVRRPLIAIFLWDGARPDRCGFGGAVRATTPEADRFANEAVVFEHARANATATTASMRMLLSGHYQARTMLDFDHAPLLLGALWDLGYRRFLINVHGSDYNGLGAEAFLRGLGERREEIARATTFFGEYDEEAKAHRALHLLDEALAADRARGAERPLDGTFLFLHSAATHFPWRRYAGSPDFGEESADRFDHALAHVDRWTGFTWRALRERGVYDDAILVLTADHGTGLGERGRPGGFIPWEEQVRVPLVIKAPGFAPRRVSYPVAGIDLVPTLLSLFRPGAQNPAHGHSLVELMAGRREALERRFVVSLASFTDAYALHDAREGMVLLFFRAGGYRFLFDLARDPREERDLAPEKPDLTRSYADHVQRFLEAGPWGRPEHYQRRADPASGATR